MWNYISVLPEIFELWVSSDEEPPHLICWPKTAWSPGWHIQPERVNCINVQLIRLHFSQFTRHCIFSTQFTRHCMFYEPASARLCWQRGVAISLHALPAPPRKILLGTLLMLWATSKILWATSEILWATLEILWATSNILWATPEILWGVFNTFNGFLTNPRRQLQRASGAILEVALYHRPAIKENYQLSIFWPRIVFLNDYLYPPKTWLMLKNKSAVMGREKCATSSPFSLAPVFIKR